MNPTALVGAPLILRSIVQRQIKKHSARIFTPCVRSLLTPLSRPSRTLFTTPYIFNAKTERTKPTTKSPPRNESLANAQPVPWHYEDINKPPVEKERGPSVTDKGKLLSTPSRLLKLLLPLKSTSNKVNSFNPTEPLALLIHPRQPLSYLERLIQSELRPITSPNSAPRPPEIAFKAVDIGDDLLAKSDPAGKPSEIELSLRGGEGEGGVETGGGLGQHSREPKSGKGGLVRWSTSTEIGDFVRDAARGREFIVEIEGCEDVAVGVPSFHERTHYLRLRLHAVTKSIGGQAKLKSECDMEAHRGAQQVAIGGFAGLLTWWGGVYWLTFKTSLGWNVMEPVTYLVGLSVVIGGYLWFLYYNREVSYRSLLHMTISSRQLKLYSQRGFKIGRWEDLVDEGKALRREIKSIAEQYDVDWDECKDEAGGERVLKVLRDGEDKRSNTTRNQEREEDGEEVVEMDSWRR